MGKIFVFVAICRSHALITNYVQSDSYNVIVALKEGVWEVESLEQLPEGQHAQISVEELLMCEEIIRKDERVIQLAKDIGECDSIVPFPA